MLGRFLGASGAIALALIINPRKTLKMRCREGHLSHKNYKRSHCLILEVYSGTDCAGIKKKVAYTFTKTGIVLLTLERY